MDYESFSEIGQALLERHEAYVRRHDKMVCILAVSVYFHFLSELLGIRA